MQLRAGGIEERIITAVKEHYPLTIEELVRMLGVGEAKVRLAVKRLAAAGILILEPLPDKTYVRPGRAVGFVGVNPKQRKALKHRRAAKKEHDKKELEGYA